MSHVARRRACAIVAAVAVAILLSALPALAHGFTSVAYVDLTSTEAGHVSAKLGLEYDLLVVSAADSEKDDPLFRAGTAPDKGGHTTPFRSAHKSARRR